MSALAAPTLFEERCGTHLHGGSPTLDDLIVGTWDELTATGVAACPLCPGELEAQRGARAAFGRCRDCGCILG